jgi:hypothetical protein
MIGQKKPADKKASHSALRGGASTEKLLKKRYVPFLSEENALVVRTILAKKLDLRDRPWEIVSGYCHDSLLNVLDVEH